MVQILKSICCSYPPLAKQNNSPQLLDQFPPPIEPFTVAANKSRQLATEESKRQALDHYVSLKASLNLLTNPAFHSAVPQYGLSNAAKIARTNFDVLDEFLRSSIETFYYNERRQLDSTTATKVFEIPELLEMVLDFTGFIDIIRMSETCTGIRSRTYDSPKSWRRLLLHAIETSKYTETEFYSPLVQRGGHQKYYYEGYEAQLDARPKDDDDDDDNDGGHDSNLASSLSKETNLYIRFKKLESHKGLRQIGKVWKDMLISQPPIKYMEVVPSHGNCTCSSDGYDSISTKTGITLGDLLVRAEKMEGRCFSCGLDAYFDFHDGRRSYLWIKGG